MESTVTKIAEVLDFKHLQIDHLFILKQLLSLKNYFSLIFPTFTGKTMPSKRPFLRQFPLWLIFLSFPIAFSSAGSISSKQELRKGKDMDADFKELLESYADRLVVDLLKHFKTMK